MLRPVRLLVVGSGDLAARAFRHLAHRSEVSVAQIPDVATALSACQLAPSDAAPHAIVLESRCLATPDREALRTLMETIPVVVLGVDPGPEAVLEALRCGARGHVDWPREEDHRLDDVLWSALAGRPALSPLITLCLLDELFSPPAIAPQTEPPELYSCSRRIRDAPTHDSQGRQAGCL